MTTRSPRYSPDTLGILRFDTTQASAGATATEGTVNTPTSPASRIGMRIHRIHATLTIPEADNPAADATTIVTSTGVISTVTGSSGPGAGSLGTLYFVQHQAVYSSAPADAGVAITVVPGETDKDYRPGILVPAQQLSVYVFGNSANTVTVRLQGYILYTLEEVNADELVAALSASQPM